MKLVRSSSNFPYRARALIGMLVRLCVGDALVGQPAVQVLQGLEAQPRREEALAHQIASTAVFMLS